MNLYDLGYRFAVLFIPFLFALCFHEFSHALVAKWLGDNTAERNGRLTMNPMAHADPIGTFALPLLAVATGSGFFFGWAKPVPVDSRNLKNPKMKMFWIALAGPASNILLGFVAMLVLGLVEAKLGASGNAYRVLLISLIKVNMFLAVFNLIPMDPLDGGKVIEPFLPLNWANWMDRHQSQLSMGLMIFFLIGGGVILLPPVAFLTNHLLDGAQAITGLFGS
jgi:Zn-dependent protease